MQKRSKIKAIVGEASDQAKKTLERVRGARLSKVKLESNRETGGGGLGADVWACCHMLLRARKTREKKGTMGRATLCWCVVVRCSKVQGYKERVLVPGGRIPKAPVARMEPIGDSPRSVMSLSGARQPGGGWPLALASRCIACWAPSSGMLACTRPGGFHLGFMDRPSSRVRLGRVVVVDGHQQYEDGCLMLACFDSYPNMVGWVRTVEYPSRL